MNRHRGALLAEAVVTMFIALLVLAAVSSMLGLATRLAELGKQRLETERTAGEAIALLAAGEAKELAAFETERRVISGGVTVRRFSLPVGENEVATVVWPKKLQ